MKDILPAHQGTLAEVHDQVLADYQKEKSVDLAAHPRAGACQARCKSAKHFDKAAKSLGLTVKTSDAFARNGSVPDVGTGQAARRRLQNAMSARSAPPPRSARTGSSSASPPTTLPNPDDLAKQRDDIQQQLLQTKQNAAFDAFHTALIDRLKGRQAHHQRRRRKSRHQPNRQFR